MADHQPSEKSHSIFTTSRSANPRRGKLQLPGRNALQTPHYIAVTSRGVVPHITQDTFQASTQVLGVYMGIEDFVERAPQEIPPVFQYRPRGTTSPLRGFTAFPDDTLLIVGARRTPPLQIPAANSNTHTSVIISTAVGFKALSAEYYSGNVDILGADIVVALGDIPYDRALGSKRIEKATDRQIQWLSDHVKQRDLAESSSNSGRLFAPLLPVHCAMQQYYIEAIEQQMSHISGLAFYSPGTLEDLPPSLQALPRLAFTNPDGPHDLLRQISLGFDILTVAFVNVATDAGIALDFTFPAPISKSKSANVSANPEPLGIDMWSTNHIVDVNPLSKFCSCYACSTHHRAYIQHLLSAKEMTGWVLLQIHNYAVIDMFFAGIRESIDAESFEADTLLFQHFYEPKLPERTGKGPRVRGYQFKAEGPAEPKKNPAPFTALHAGQEALAESELPSPSVTANVLEAQGLAEPGQS